jgi:hypothetical protein
MVGGGLTALQAGTYAQGASEEKGTSQTQLPVIPQRTSHEVGRRAREMRGFDMTQAVHLCNCSLPPDVEWCEL